MIRPEIIIKAYHAKDSVLKEIQAGIEEEGVLCKVIQETYSADQHTLGCMAAQMSQLETGIGIYEEQAVLCIRNIKDTPLFTTDVQYRKLGQNAARYVKGNPLIVL